MINHSPEVKQCHAYDPLSGNLSVLAGKDYEIGGQVCSPCSLALTYTLTGGYFFLDLYILRVYSK